MDESASISEYPWRKKRLLQQLFAWKGLTIRELAERFDCSERTIENWLRRHQISRPWEHERTLRFLREERQLSQYEIAARLGCTQGTISHRFEEFDIDGTRITPKKPWHDEDTLRELYQCREHSMEGIAKELGCDYQTIEHWIHYHGIETRPRNPPTPEELLDETTLRKLYCEKGLSTYAIADKVGCAPSSVHHWLIKHSIDTRNVGSQPGTLHHRWKGGREPYYGENWHKRRRNALQRDQQTCRECGMTQDEHEQKYSFGLDVHHVVPLREFETPEEANDLNNLVTLCRSCHNAIEYEGSEE